MPGLVEPVELAPLVEKNRLRGVEIFRLPTVDDAAAEGDDAATDVPDREHDAIAEAVVVPVALTGGARLAPAGITLDDEAEIGERLALRLARTEALQHRIPGVRRVADAELREGVGSQPAACQVLAGAGLTRERLGVELRYPRHELVELLGVARCGGRAAAFVRHFQSQPARELLDGLGEGHAVVLHQKAQHRAVRAAAEAVIELLLRAHPEGGGLLVVEGTAGLVLAARFLQLHARADDLHDVRAGDQLVDEALGDDGWVLLAAVARSGPDRHDLEPPYRQGLAITRPSASVLGQLLLHAGTDDTHVGATLRLDLHCGDDLP